MKQAERVLKYMRDFGSITQLEAIRDISCMRLGARIFDLKREGYEIKKETETSKNRYGEDTSYARYRLVEICLSTLNAFLEVRKDDCVLGLMDRNRTSTRNAMMMPRFSLP